MIWLISIIQLTIITRMGNNTQSSSSTSPHHLTQLFKIISRDPSSNCLFLQQKHTGRQFLLKQFSTNSTEQFHSLQSKLKQRQLNSHPQVLSIYDITSKTETNLCSHLHKLSVVIEHPFRTLAQEVKERRKQSEHFSENQLWSILYSCALGLGWLYSKGDKHLALSSSRVYIESQGLIKISDPDLLGQLDNLSSTRNRSQDQHIYLSPEQLQSLQQIPSNTTPNKFSAELSDVFTLGMILLESIHLQWLDNLYHNGSVNNGSLQLTLSRTPKIYSDLLVSTVASMLRLEPRERINLKDIEKLIESSSFEQEMSPKENVMSPQNMSAVGIGQQRQQTVFPSMQSSATVVGSILQPQNQNVSHFVGEGQMQQQYLSDGGRQFPLKPLGQHFTSPAITSTGSPQFSNIAQWLTRNPQPTTTNNNYLLPSYQTSSSHHHNQTNPLSNGPTNTSNNLSSSFRPGPLPNLNTSSLPTSSFPSIPSPSMQHLQFSWSSPTNSLSSQLGYPVTHEHEQMNSNLEMLESKIKKLSEFAASRNYDAKQMVATTGPTPQMSTPQYSYSVSHSYSPRPTPTGRSNYSTQPLPPSSSTTTLLHPFTSTIPTIQSVHPQVPHSSHNPPQPLSSSPSHQQLALKDLLMEIQSGGNPNTPKDFPVANEILYKFTTTNRIGLDTVAQTNEPETPTPLSSHQTSAKPSFNNENRPIKKERSIEKINSQLVENEGSMREAFTKKESYGTVGKQAGNMNLLTINNGKVESKKGKAENTHIRRKSDKKEKYNRLTLPKVNKDGSLSFGEESERQAHKSKAQQQSDRPSQTGYNPQDDSLQIPSQKKTTKQSKLSVDWQPEGHPPDPTDPNNHHPSCSSLQQYPQYCDQQYQHGSKYQGYKLHSMRHGFGKFFYQDGGHYQGQWHQNKMHGFGKLYYQNGQIAYQGYWHSDQFHGRGKVFNNTTKYLFSPFDYRDFTELGDCWLYYDGMFERDSRTGLGTIKLSNGELFEGVFLSDEMEGPGKFYRVDGGVVEGVWKGSRMVVE